MAIEIDISVVDIQPFTIVPGVASQTLIGGGGRLYGWSIRETTGAATAVVRFTSGGNIIATIGLAAGASESRHFGQGGIAAEQDITAVVVAGAIEGAAYIGLVV